MANPRKYLNNIIDIKKTADMRWNQIYSLLMKGEKVDHGIIGRCMMECNNADLACLNQKLNINELNSKK